MEQRAEVTAHEIEGGEIADPVVERGRAPEVGEQDRQARDLEPLLGIERPAAIEIAERLVAEQAGRGQERPAGVGELVHLVAVQPDPRHRPALSLVFERDARRARLDFLGAAVGMRVGEDERQIPPLLGLLPLDLQKERRVGHGLEDNHKSLREVERHRRLFAPSELHRVKRHRLDSALDIVRELVARAPEDLAHVFGERKRIRIVRGDAANPRIDGEGDLDQPVERRLAIDRAERAIILGLIEVLQRRTRLDYARRKTGTTYSTTCPTARAAPHGQTRRWSASSSRPCALA